MTLTTAGPGPTAAYWGNVTQFVLVAFLMFHVLPFVRPGTTFFMDRLSAHCGKYVRALIEHAGCHLVLEAPYSPEYAPIEEAIGKVKHFVKKEAARTKEALLKALRWAIRLVTPDDAKGYFADAVFELLHRTR